jgi:hypothetical protein
MATQRGPDCAATETSMTGSLGCTTENGFEPVGGARPSSYRCGCQDRLPLLVGCDCFGIRSPGYSSGRGLWWRNAQRVVGRSGSQPPRDGMECPRDAVLEIWPARWHRRRHSLAEGPHQGWTMKAMDARRAVCQPEGRAARRPRGPAHPSGRSRIECYGVSPCPIRSPRQWPWPVLEARTRYHGKPDLLFVDDRVGLYGSNGALVTLRPPALSGPPRRGPLRLPTRAFSRRLPRQQAAWCKPR